MDLDKLYQYVTVKSSRTPVQPLILTKFCALYTFYSRV